jgi:VanZ family protein
MFKKLASYKFTIAAACLILVALLLPSKSIPKFPSFVGIDKLAHFTLFFIFTTSYLVESRRERHRLPSLLFSVFFIGLFILCSELLQLLTSSRSFELADMAFDVLGTLFSIIILLGVSRLLRKAPRRET